MIGPLSLANVLTVIFAVICLSMVMTQRSDRIQKVYRLAVPPGLAIVVALMLLAGVFDAGAIDDALWVGGAIVGFVLGRVRGRVLAMDVLPGSGSVRVTQTADNLASALALLAAAGMDFFSAVRREPVLDPILVAAAGALCAGFLAGRFLMVAVRADPIAGLKKAARRS